MSDKKIYSYDDLTELTAEHTKLIDKEFDKLNTNKDIIYPSEQDYKKISENAIEKLINKDRCLGMYMSGKKRGGRCQASPHLDSKYCLKHQSQDPDNKKDNESNPDPEILKEAIELIRKAKLNK